MLKTDPRHFPRGFMWGAATAAHQIEGHNIHSDWWAAEQAGRLPHRSESANDSWTRWSEDVELLKTIGLNAYRMSVEWARVEPAPGQFDQHALDTYRKQIETLREAGIEPLVTLHHFTNPLWLAEQGGWANPAVIGHMARYADRVGHEIGHLVRWWVTINEPSILGLKGYIEGSWPPHRPLDVRGFLRLQRHAVRAHSAARQVLRGYRPDVMASMAFALWPMQPLRRWSPIDQAMARIADFFWQGRVLRRTVRTLDWIGVNYYSRTLVGWPWPNTPSVHAGGTTDFGWEIYPDGLTQTLRRVGRFRKPVVVTENGIADANDHQRAAYIVAHVQRIHQAITEGIDVRGYMYWSLLDNFEWAEGYAQKFGLATRDRVLRPSAQVYGAIARANGVGSELGGTFSVT